MRPEIQLEIAVVSRYGQRHVDSFLLEIGRKYLSKDLKLNKIFSFVNHYCMRPPLSRFGLVHMP